MNRIFKISLLVLVLGGLGWFFLKTNREDQEVAATFDGSCIQRPAMSRRWKSDSSKQQRQTSLGLKDVYGNDDDLAQAMGFFKAADLSPTKALVKKYSTQIEDYLDTDGRSFWDVRVGEFACN